MKKRGTSKGVFCCLALVLLTAGISQAAAGGFIKGTVRGPEGQRLGGVTVLALQGGSSVTAEVTAPDGGFALSGVDAGIYDLQFLLGERSSMETGVVVSAGETTMVEKTVDWPDVGFVETVVVTAGSRKRERLVDAPSAMTTLGPETIELGAATGQVAELLEFTPGAQITQSGLYDFNFNSRGFNQALTRRVQVLMDGRDVGIPFLDSQEWAQFIVSAEDLESIEYIRGPSSALYGANSFNGVMSLTTKAPRDSEGGLFRLTGGELSTLGAAFRWAGSLGDGWYLKAMAGTNQSDDFGQSRNAGTEYEGLVPEAIPLPGDKTRSNAATLRVDKYFGEDKLMTIEGGYSELDNVNFVSPAGRSFITDSDRPYFRFNFNAPRYNVLAYYNDRDAPDGINMATGGLFSLESWSYKVEVQGNTPFSWGRLIGGVSYGEEEVDSADSQGNQTLIADSIRSEEKAVFGQLDWDVSDKVKIMLALRYDDSDLYDSEFSPKAAVVYSIDENHKLRFTYNEAFQSANYGELYIDFPAGALDLSELEAGLAGLLGGATLGFENVPIRVLGNPDLETEKIKSYEIGYTGILGNRALLNVNYYRNELEDFITDVLPGVNPNHPPWVAPDTVPEANRPIVEGIVNSEVFGMSNGADGSPEFVLSRGNAGNVDTQGLELALSLMAGQRWMVDVNYSWFDFDTDPEAGINTANSPENSASAGISYLADRWMASVQYRWSDSFDWQSGVHVGPVPSYDTVDVSASWDINDFFTVGMDVDNALNNVHYEIFGGDLLERRALLYVKANW